MKKYIFSIILIGCGTQQPETKETFIETQSPVIPQEVAEKEKTALPPMAMTVSGEKPVCGAENENQLIYHVDDGLFYSCKGNDWAVIDLKGKDGEKGKDGVDGIKGEDGANGLDGNNAVIKSAWKPASDYSFCVTYNHPTFGSNCPLNVIVILYSNGYVALELNGGNLSLSMVGKIVYEEIFFGGKVVNERVEFDAKITDRLGVRYTLVFEGSMGATPNLTDFIWQPKDNGILFSGYSSAQMYPIN